MSISNDESAISDTTGAHEPRRIVVIGAGPAGLTAAYEFMKLGAAADVTILESDTVVGGISQTVQRDGWRFDIGGHRFFTKVKVVDELWDEILAPETMLDRPRQSRILYRGKLYEYPLVPMNALRNLGPVEAVRASLSYVWARVHPPKNQDNLEGFYTARFGWRLYEHFFKTYTEKVWGVPPSELSADWGAQRVKDLSIVRAVLEALKPKRCAARVTRRRGHEPDRGVQVPEVRPGNDVGDRGREGHRRRRRARVRPAGHAHRARRARCVRGRRGRRRGHASTSTRART